jgi:predicted HicB family RNase H-like nuclease
MNTEADDTVKVLNLRLDEALHRQLTAEARRSVRSLNGEIVFRLRKSLEIEAPTAKQAAGALLIEEGGA